MMKRVIKPGDKSRQGNAVCPRCGERVLLPRRITSDPSRCNKCDVPYRITPPRMQVMG